MAEKNTPKIIRPQAGFQEKFVSSNVDFAVGGGVLNPQPIDSLVATPNGFVRIGDLNAGDVICDVNGGTQQVVFVIDKGELPCVEFTLSDGRSVRSALEHNWRIIDKHGRCREVTAEHIVNYMRYSEDGKRINKTNYHIPLCKPTIGLDELLPIHPYVLGFLIGDGCFSEKSTYPVLTTKDYEVVEKFRLLGYRVEEIKNRTDNIHYYIKDVVVKQHLQSLGLWGKRAYEKIIPICYKRSNVEDRIMLLQGLFDSDGTCSKNHQVSFGTTSCELAKDVKEVIHSLGGRCSLSVKAAKDRDWGNHISHCIESYTLYPKLKDDSLLFSLVRKKELTITDDERVEKASISIVSYRMLPKCQMRCINVSGEDHLYLTDNYVVTCNCGKSFAAVLSVAEPSMDGRFRGLFLRNNLGDAKASGGILDTFKECYGRGCEVVESGEPRVTFPSGAKIDVTHVADQSREKVLQRFKGRQYDFIYFDEGTGFSWECFTSIYTRNRGTASWTGKVRMTTNPDRNHWLRTFLDWYIGIDGFIREDREGVIRYFYMAGETVKDVVWGDSKEECYQKCKIDIDRKLRKINGNTGNATYKDMIKSFTFYLGRISENKASIGNNSGYVGSVAVSGGRNAEQLLEGNWNVSPEEDLNAVIPSDIANKVFVVDAQINNDRWITADLADTGTDNFLCLSWDGFHINDVLILGKTTPRENAERLLAFAEKHDVPNSHIVYDGIRGIYINDYIPEAIPFISNMKPMGMYGRMALRLKDECYLRLVEMLKRGELSMDDTVANRTYEHALLKERISIQNEFLEECAVVRFKDAQSGKKTLLSKKEMNQMLGRGRSMDLLDPIAMRMFPVLHLPYGDELVGTMGDDDDYDDNDENDSVFDETLWC